MGKVKQRSKIELICLQRHNQSQKSRVKLVKNRQKALQKALIFTALDTSQLKKFMIVKIFTV